MTDSEAQHNRSAGPAQEHSLTNELRELQGRIDGLRARMRAAVDLLGVLLLGISGAALLIVAVLAVIGFVGGDTGIGLLFSSLTIICLPLVAFAAWRAFRPLWRLSRELNLLRIREQQLLSQLAPPAAPAKAASPAKAVKAAKAAARAGGKKGPAIEERLPPGHTPTGWRPTPPPVKIASVLSTKQVGWRIVVLIAVIMLLFAAGAITGVLARG